MTLAVLIFNQVAHIRTEEKHIPANQWKLNIDQWKYPEAG